MKKDVVLRSKRYHLKNIVPSNLHKSRVIDFREIRLKKIISFVDLMLEEKSLCETLEKLLNIAEDDSRSLKRLFQQVSVLKTYNHIRKMDLIHETLANELEALFKSLVKFHKYAQASEIGEELLKRFESEGNNEKLEWILKQLIFISINNEEKKTYKLKLYGIYMNGNNWGSLQSSIVDHISNLIDDQDKREVVKSGLNELINVFKLEFNQVKFDILNEVNGKLQEKGMSPITLPERPNIDTYGKIETEEINTNNEEHITETGTNDVHITEKDKEENNTNNEVHITENGDNNTNNEEVDWAMGDLLY